MTGGPPEYSMPEHSQRRTNGQWPTFFIMLGILGAMGLVVCYLLILPMAMMTDGCHEGSLEWQCRLSGRGQNAALLLSPERGSVRDSGGVRCSASRSGFWPDG